MKNSYSKTAMMVALVRAAHTKLEEGEIYQDIYAAYFVDFPYTLIFRHLFLFNFVRNRVLKKVQTIPTQNLYRSRYVEEYFKGHRGEFGTVINFSAGFDGFALKQAELNPNIQFIEVDHPLTQQRKLAILQKKLPKLFYQNRIRYIEVDYEKESLEEKFELKVDEIQQPVLGIWMGTSYYLRKETINQFLTFFSSKFPPKSRLIFDLGLAENELGKEDQAIYKEMENYVNQKGEPMLSRFSWEEIACFSKDFNFEILEKKSILDLNYHQATPTYYPKSDFSVLLVLENK